MPVEIRMLCGHRFAVSEADSTKDMRCPFCKDKPALASLSPRDEALEAAILALRNVHCDEERFGDECGIWNSAIESGIKAIRALRAPAEQNAVAANPQRRLSVENSEVKPDESTNRSTVAEGSRSKDGSRSDAIRPSRTECGPRDAGEIANEVSVGTTAPQGEHPAGAAPDRSTGGGAEISAMKDTCPKCGNKTLGFGYGLAGGGIGSYTYCDTEGCDYFDKTQDPEIGADPDKELCPLVAATLPSGEKDEMPDVPKIVKLIADNREVPMALMGGEVSEIADYIDALRQWALRRPDERDKDWVLAMGPALGLDSGYHVPIVPTVEAFKKLFDDLRRPAPPADMVMVPREPTEKMVDAARQIILYAETPGRTLEGLRAHLVASGVDYLAWFPVWATRDTGHLTKAAIAILIYKAMLAASPEAGDPDER